MLNKYVLENYKNNNKTINENNNLEEQMKLIINVPHKIIKDEKVSSNDDNLGENIKENNEEIEKVLEKNKIQKEKIEIIQRKRKIQEK